MKAAAVIVAAGSSQRMGTDKILADLCYMPVIARTLLAFEKSEYIEEILIVTRQDILGDMADLCKKYGISKATQVLAGGSTRMESALIGVSNLKKNSPLIAIHDGARPLVTQKIIEDTVKAAYEKNAAIPVIKCTDTMKLVDDERVVVGTVDREKLLRVQTPQVFEADIIKGALTFAAEKGLAITDDASAVEILGFKIATVDGDEENIKLTTPNDFLIAREILKKRGEFVENRSWL